MCCNDTLLIIKKKIDDMMLKIDPEKPFEPRGISKNGKYTDKLVCFYQPGWTYSFYLAVIAYMYLHFKDEKYLDYLKKCKTVYTNYLFDNEAEIGHDTGFLYSLYAVPMYKITGEKIYRILALKAADEIAKRIRIKPGHIQAFYDLRLRGITDEISLMIVDDMMNMCLLMWAYKETGHSFYRDVYKMHIETAVRNLIRDDFSVRHAFHFDVSSGNPVSEMNYCGYSVGSHWARGTSWMIYGLTKVMQLSGENERYRYMLEGVTEKYIDCLDGKNIPVWDFKLPCYAKDRYEDTSAACITASAFMEFDEIGVNKNLTEVTGILTDRLLEELCTEKYLAGDDKEYVLDYGNNEGCLWGDYFFTELLMKKIHKKDTMDFWL